MHVTVNQQQIPHYFTLIKQPLVNPLTFTSMRKQIETIHVDKQLKPEQLKQYQIVMRDCGQHLSNSQL